MVKTVSFFVVIQDDFEFKPIIAGQPARFVQPYLVQLTDDNKVQLNGDHKATFTFAGRAYTGVLCDDTAQITVLGRTQRDFTFSVCASDGRPAPYFLTGVKLNDTADGKGAGPVFPIVKVDFNGRLSSILTLEDRPGPQTLNYEMWLMLQNSDGELGLVDPRIVNQN